MQMYHLCTTKYTLRNSFLMWKVECMHESSIFKHMLNVLLPYKEVVILCDVYKLKSYCTTLEKHEGMMGWEEGGT